MSSPSADPEKYSLDEMLERLQGKSGDDSPDQGELVTRADGSQAVKVRKRKRRSTQPHKEAAKKNAKIRAIQVSAAVILLVLLVLTFGGIVLYTNSPPYRAAVVSKFNTATGGETELIQTSVSPLGFAASRVNVKWPEGNIFKSLSVQRIRGNSFIGGVLGGTWSAGEITANTGQLHLGLPVTGEKERFTAASRKSPVSFERLGVSSADITIGQEANPALKFSKSEFSFYPTSKSGHPSVRLFKGEARIPEWPVFRLDRANLEFHENEVEISSLRLLHEFDNAGNIELSGTFNPHDLDKEQTLQVKMNGFNLSGIAGTSLGNLVSGRVDTRNASIPNALTFSSQNRSGKLSAAFASSQNTLPKLNNFPFLGILSRLTDNPWFLDPLFHDGCTGILHRDGGIARISDLSLVSRSQFKVTGDLSVQPNDVLSGVLDIGLPEALILNARNKSLEQIFTESRDGFKWTSLKISGTSGRPIDNFAELAASASKSAPASPDSPDLFEQLTTPPSR